MTTLRPTQHARRAISRFAVAAGLLLGALLLAACAASGAGGRPVDVTQMDDGCTPTVIEAIPGEKLDLRVKNETSKTYEIEGIDGTNLEEVLVPEGRERSVGFNVPDSGGTYHVKCYVPGGVSTIIEIRAGDGSAAGTATADSSNPNTDLGPSDTTVSVGLREWAIDPDQGSVAAGAIRFDAINESIGMVHELAVVQVQDDGDFEVVGEIENLGAGESGSIVRDLPAGDYQLACLIVPGEAGSTADHYQQGMWTEFTVE